MWYKAEGLSDDSDNKPLRLPIATFYIKRIGWRLDDGPSDLFCLVNRINPDISDPDYSSSRFKGTGGTKFMLTYTSNRLGKPTIQQKPSATGIYYSVYNKGKFTKTLKLFQPSFGLGISYLDFDTKNSVEMGVGPIIGLFHNTIFCHVGYNLNATKESWFYGIGFSLIDTKAKFQSLITD